MNLSQTLMDWNLRLSADGRENQMNVRNIYRTFRLRAKRRLFERQLLMQPRYFCQSSGACGSTYIVQLLQTNQVPRCFHEKSPDLDRLGVEHYVSPMNRSRLSSLLRYTRWDVIFEANNRLFSLSLPLADAFPTARFIHLHRDPRQVVPSNLSKPNLDDYISTSHRMRRELAGPVDAPALERFCHYWTNINRRIVDDLQRIAEQRGPHLSLDFDHLITGQIHTLEQFIGHTLEIKKQDAVNRRQVGTQGRYPPFELWATSDQQRLWDICGPTMNRLGYR